MVRIMRGPALRPTASLCLVLATTAPSGAGDEPPHTTALNEVELTVSSVAVGLLDQGCDYGSHRESIRLRGTGEARLTFEVLGGECTPEEYEFAVPRAEVEELLSQLFEQDFHRLEADYSGGSSLCIDCVEGYPPGTLFTLTTITSHAADITVTLRMADFEHTVHYSDGARVAGLTEWVDEWRPRLWRRAGFLRHFPPEER